jgi:hypothetical protein
VYVSNAPNRGRHAGVASVDQTLQHSRSFQRYHHQRHIDS